jgi:hypothetical protein
MVYQKRSKKLLLISTAITIAALASVLTVYAAVLGTFYGNPITVNNVASGTVTYSTDGGSTWSANPSDINAGSTLYARFELTTASYSGAASISWQLQESISGSWTNEGSPVTTTVTLTGSAQTIYASADGTTTGNHNWGTGITTGGSYRVMATVSTA